MQKSNIFVPNVPFLNVVVVSVDLQGSVSSFIHMKYTLNSSHRKLRTVNTSIGTRQFWLKTKT